MDHVVAVIFVLTFCIGVFVGFKFGKPIGMRLAAVKLCGEELVTYAEVKYHKIEDVIDYLKEKI